MSDLGTASGKITIDVSQLEAARAAVNAFATGVNTTLTGISSSVNATSASFTTLTNSVRQVAGAFGLSFGVAGLVQLGKMAIAATETATAFNRQGVAALSLAGSQERLNILLAAYERASGGAVDRATELAAVTNLLAQGFASTGKDVERFVGGVRGAAIAMGQTQDYIQQYVALAIANQSTKRLNEIGLGVAEVEERIASLRATSVGMTQEAAFQAAVLGLLNEKYGELAKSVEGQKSGIEHAKSAWTNLGLTIGEVLSGPTNAAGNALTFWLDDETAKIQLFIMMIKEAQREIDHMRGIAPPPLTGSIASRTGIGSSIRETPQSMTSDSQLSAISAWEQRRAGIAKQAISDIADEEAQFGRQRADTIANYNKDIERGAEDFGRQRAQAEQNLQDSIADVQADGARRQVQQAAELSRTIANAQRDSADRLADLQDDLDRTVSERRADSADKIAEMEDDRDKSITEKKGDTAKRIIEIEQDYNEQRIRAEAQYHLDRQSAAMRNDGRALFELDARHKLESEQALEAKDKQINDEKSKLDEAIQKVNDSYTERLADEAAALAKSIKQANDAHDRQVKDEKEALQKRIDNANSAYTQQLADGTAADNQRISDLKDAFDKEKTQADTEYGLRLTRQKTDFDDQLKQQDDAHKLRITQIENHAQAERDTLDDEFIKEMDGLGLHNAAWLAAQKTQQDDALKLFDTFWKALGDRFGVSFGPATKPDTSVLDPRRQQLQGTIEEWKRQLAATSDPEEISRLQGLISQMQKAIDALGPAGSNNIIGASGAAFNMPSASAFSAMPAPVMASAMGGGGSNRSLAVTFAKESIVVHGAQGQSETVLADAVAKEVLRLVQYAAGRM